MKDEVLFLNSSTKCGLMEEIVGTSFEVYAESMFIENSIYKLIYWGFKFYDIVLVIVVQ